MSPKPDVILPPPPLTGVAEDGLPGSGRQTGAGFRAADHGGGGGVPLEGAGRETGPGVQAADGGLRGSAPRQARPPGQRGDTLKPMPCKQEVDLPKSIAR